MENQLLNYENENINQFQQQLNKEKTLVNHVYKLQNMFSYLFLGYCCFIIAFFFYCRNISELNNSLIGGRLFWLFPASLFGLIKYHKKYNREKKAFIHKYKNFLIPKMLHSFQATYLYANKAEYEDENYELTIECQIPLSLEEKLTGKKEEEGKIAENADLKVGKPENKESLSQTEQISLKPNNKQQKKEKKQDGVQVINRKINPDIQKMIDVGLLERGNGGFQAYWLMLLFPFLNVFFGRGLLIRFLTKKKPNFEDFFGITKDKTSFKAIEIQALLRSITNNTPNSKFLTKFSYQNIKYTLAKKTKFLIKLTSLKTKRKNFQFSIKKILFYGGAFILLGLPLLDLLFSHKKPNTIEIHLMMMGLIFAFFGLGFVRLISLAYKKRYGNYTKKAKKLTNIQKTSVLFSEDFLEYYDIQTNDQLFANEFLNPSLKEKLMLLHQQYRGSYDFYFEGQDFYCIKHLPKGRHFLDAFSHRNRNNPKTITKLYSEIKELNLLFSLLER